MATAPEPNIGIASLNRADLSAGERDELIALGILSAEGELQPRPARRGAPAAYERVPRTAVSAPEVLNEAHHYARPGSFSRGLRLELGDYVLLITSGTASVDEAGRSIHAGDFRAQCWRTYRNITALLGSEGAAWDDVVKATCYLRDIERDYKDFNEVRTAFFTWLKLDPLPASVGVQARLCRDDLLVEIEAIAVLKNRN